MANACPFCKRQMRRAEARCICDNCSFTANVDRKIAWFIGKTNNSNLPFWAVLFTVVAFEINICKPRIVLSKKHPDEIDVDEFDFLFIDCENEGETEFKTIKMEEVDTDILSEYSHLYAMDGYLAYDLINITMRNNMVCLYDNSAVLSYLYSMWLAENREEFYSMDEAERITWPFAPNFTHLCDPVSTTLNSEVYLWNYAFSTTRHINSKDTLDEVLNNILNDSGTGDEEYAVMNSTDAFMYKELVTILDRNPVFINGAYTCLTHKGHPYVVKLIKEKPCKYNFNWWKGYTTLLQKIAHNIFGEDSAKKEFDFLDACKDYLRRTFEAE